MLMQPSGTVADPESGTAREYVTAERERRVRSAHRLASFGKVSTLTGFILLIAIIAAWAVGGASVVGGPSLIFAAVISIGVAASGFVMRHAAANTAMIRCRDDD